jgi:conserved repeat domain
MEYKMIVDTDGIEKPGVVFIINGLANGEEAELTFRVNAPTETDNPSTPDYESSRVYTNTASLFDEEFNDTRTSETTYHQIQVPVLEALKTSNLEEGTKVKQGDTITYYIQVKNTGHGIAKNVIIKDSIPEFTTYITNTANSNKENTRHTFSKTANQENLIWIVETLAPGETVTVSFQVTVDKMETLGVREIKNTAQIKLPKEGENPEEVAKEKDGYTDTNEVKHTQENQVPQKTTTQPKTGDRNNLELLVAMLAMSIVLIIYVEKRKDKKVNLK